MIFSDKALKPCLGDFFIRIFEQVAKCFMQFHTVVRLNCLVHVEEREREYLLKKRAASRFWNSGSFKGFRAFGSVKVECKVRAYGFGSAALGLRALGLMSES